MMKLHEMARVGSQPLQLGLHCVSTKYKYTLNRQIYTLYTRFGHVGVLQSLEQRQVETFGARKEMVAWPARTAKDLSSSNTVVPGKPRRCRCHRHVGEASGDRSPRGSFQWPEGSQEHQLSTRHQEAICWRFRVRVQCWVSPVVTISDLPSGEFT